MRALTADVIRDRLRIEPARLLPEIRVHAGHPGSRLGDLVGADGAAPYWAYGWAGGTVLARHVLDRPDTVAMRRVLDLGCGGGVVAIAAAMAGAARVLASDIDANALVAATLNAALNGVAIETIGGDLVGGPRPDVDVVLVGDLFYDALLAKRVLPWLQACAAGGITVLIGDPYRAHLPQAALRLVATYDVPDFGSGGGGRAGVFALV